MRKYLKQNSLNAFTIWIPRNGMFVEQPPTSFERDSITRNERIFRIRFANYFQANLEKGYHNLPNFNCFAVFYDVQFVGETEELLEFNLIFNQTLNKSIWLRLKHAIFNQYNALIGFSEVLQEVDELDDTDRVLLKRINVNARDMFRNTNLLMEFEQLKAFDFDLATKITSPDHYFSSYLQHRNKPDDKDLNYHDSIDNENVTLNIDSNYFKTSLNLLLDMIDQSTDLSKVDLHLNIKGDFHITIEIIKDEIYDVEFLQEIQFVNDFFDMANDLKPISIRMFHLMYIRLIAEKLGGIFRIYLKNSPNSKLIVEWVFPIISIESNDSQQTTMAHPDRKTEKKSVPHKKMQKYSKALKQEIAENFIKVDGTYVLDDWRKFANSLDISCLKCKNTEKTELKEIADKIRSATDAFDIMALQSIKLKIRQIVESD